MNESFDITIKEGLRFLARHQEADGSFFCLVTEKPDDYSFEEKCPAIVPSNIVLSSLSKLPGTSLVESIKQKTASFLLSQKGDYWSFNYWFRNSEEYVSLPYPDDLDDTFCALAALYEYNPGLFDGEVMARIATMLTSAEKQEGGPYDMWLVSPDGHDTRYDRKYSYEQARQGVIKEQNVTEFRQEVSKNLDKLVSTTWVLKPKAHGQEMSDSD